MGKLTISMAIFNSYVKLPEGTLHGNCNGDMAGSQRSGFRGNQELFRGNVWCQGNFNSWAASHSNALWMVVVLYMFWEKLGQMGWRQWCFVASHVWCRYWKALVLFANILSLPISSSIPHWFFRTWVTPNIQMSGSQGEIPGQRSHRVSLRKSHHGRDHRGWRHRGWNLPVPWRFRTAPCQFLVFPVPYLWMMFGMATLMQYWSRFRKHVMIWIWISILAWYTIRYPCYNLIGGYMYVILIPISNVFKYNPPVNLCDEFAHENLIIIQSPDSAGARKGAKGRERARKGAKGSRKRGVRAVFGYHNFG